MRKAYELNYHAILLPESVGGMGLTPLQEAIVYEELAWGSFGLTVAIIVALFPALLATLMGSKNLSRISLYRFAGVKTPVSGDAGA